MKIKYFILFSFIGLLTGCSSVHTVADFGTKERFNRRCASAIAGKEVVVEMSDGRRTGAADLTLNSDSAFIPEYRLGRSEERKISFSEIKDIVYGKPYQPEDTSESANIVLKSGERLSLENLHLSHESLAGKSFFPCQIPLRDIKSISFQAHAKATIGGILIGAASVIVAAETYSLMQGKYKSSTYLSGGDDDFLLQPQLILVGGAVGGIAGWIIGNQIVYQF